MLLCCYDNISHNDDDRHLLKSKLFSAQILKIIIKDGLKNRRGNNFWKSNSEFLAIFHYTPLLDYWTNLISEYWWRCFLSLIDHPPLQVIFIIIVIFALLEYLQPWPIRSLHSHHWPITGELAHNPSQLPLLKVVRAGDIWPPEPRPIRSKHRGHVIWLRPIRSKYWGHVTALPPLLPPLRPPVSVTQLQTLPEHDENSQSEASIQVTWSDSTNQRTAISMSSCLLLSSSSCKLVTSLLPCWV